MTFTQVLNVLKRISDEDCMLLGLNPKYARPDWMILQVLPIPPPPVRPSVMMDTSARSEASLSCSTTFFCRGFSFEVIGDLFDFTAYKFFCDLCFYTFLHGHKVSANRLHWKFYNITRQLVYYMLILEFSIITPLFPSWSRMI